MWGRYAQERGPEAGWSWSKGAPEALMQRSRGGASHQGGDIESKFPQLKKTVDTLSYKTVSANKATVDKQWLLIDATDQILGRLASKVAKTLRGKNKPNFTPHVDCGDNVVIINADKIKLTGNKLQQRVIKRYSGYPGGRHDKTLAEVMGKNSIRLIEHAVKGMLPKNRLGAQLFRNLYVYPGAEHAQEAQQPKKIDLNEIL